MMDKAALDFDQSNTKEGFAPGTTDVGRRMLTPGALAGLNRVQTNREQMQRGTAFKDAGAGAASFANSNLDVKPDELEAQTGIRAVDGTPVRLEAARLAASAKGGGGGNVRIELPIPVGGTPGTLKLSGSDAGALQQQAEDIQRSSGGQGEGLPTKAAAALTARKLPLTGYTKAADGSFVKVAKDGSVLRVTPQGDIFDNGQKVK
jgi:hypothetical protein